MANEIEKYVFQDPDKACNNGQKLFQKLIEEISKESGVKVLNSKGDIHVANTLKSLKNKNKIKTKDFKRFEKARSLRNVVAHSTDNFAVEFALEFNKSLFECCKWYYKEYFYVGYRNNDNIIYKELKPEDFPVEGQNIYPIENNLPENYKLLNTKGSFLAGELSKLSMSSRFVIDDSEDFNYFNNYIHVDRVIQSEFLKVLENSSEKNLSQLILLTGSVGDGKSHMLAYLNENHGEVMDKFEIHNDATESFGPHLTCIDTLIRLLDPFSDKNIKNSNQKQILAINLGILRELLDSDIFSENFSKLKQLIEDTEILTAEEINIDNYNGLLKIINFSDYPIYELEEDMFSSKFLDELFDKITSDSLDNPFNIAYQLDLKNDVINPVIKNYEMLRKQEVKEIVIQTLLKYLIKNKKMISTREILNFISQILIPSNFDFSENLEVYDNINNFLPSLLFNSNTNSKILAEISRDSPLNKRSKELDDFLVSLNTFKISEFFDVYFENSEEIDFLKDFLLNSYDSLEEKEKEKVKTSLLYFAIFFGNAELKNALRDENYDSFVRYLYEFNKGTSKLEMKRLFKKIKNSIFKWKGEIDKDIISIDKVGDFEIGAPLDIAYNSNYSPSSQHPNKCKINISYNFLLNGEECEKSCPCDDKLNCVSLDIDYLLFESIMKIDNGYRPNKKERENLMVFNDFINSLLLKNNKKETIVKNIVKNDSYKFKKSSGMYIFEGEK